MPQDVKLSPDGRVFYVADMIANGVWEIDGRRLQGDRLPAAPGAARTGSTRAATRASLRHEPRRGHDLGGQLRARGVVSDVDDPRRRQPRHGRRLGRRQGAVALGPLQREVYAISTRTGKLLARIPVGSGPHGLCVWPQPGRYSLGHTGILR